MSHDMAMPLIVGQEWRRRISRMQWLLNAVLAVECLRKPFIADGALAAMVWLLGGFWAWGGGWRPCRRCVLFGGVGVAAAPGSFFQQA